MSADGIPIEWGPEPSHTRCLDIALVAGEGETLEFRADILDLRKAGLMALAGRVATAGIIHNMTLLGRCHATSGEILDLSWEQSHVMHEANAASRGECCRDPMGRLRGLVGARLGEGFREDLKRNFGGALGCSHVNTLFQELSRTIAHHMAQRPADPTLAAGQAARARVARRAIFFDAFLPEAGTLATLRVRLSDAQYGAAGPGGDEVMAQHAEVRLAARVDLMGWKIEDLRAAERSRGGPEIGAEAWTDRSGLVAELIGQSLGGGMARRCADRFAGHEQRACLLSALLCLAPGMTQVGAGLSDALEPSTGARPERTGSPLSGGGPCYLLRGDGPLMQIITGGGEKG